MAKPMPAAECDIDAGVVRRLLASQHRDLASRQVTFLAGGWDNVMYRLGADLVIRLPRRGIAAQLITHERRWLPSLAARLPLPVPAPVRAGAPDCGYPWPWSVVPYIPGAPAADALDVLDAGPDAGAAPGGGAGRVDFAAVAADLGGFLGSLHVPAPANAPVNPFRGVPLSERAEVFHAELLPPAVAAAAADPVVAPDGATAFRDAALRVWDDALAAPSHGSPPVWLHGDLHPMNILLDGGHVSGVIDWGDINAGDPACDLSSAWMLLPPRWHGLLRAAYEQAGGAASEPLWRRARGWALRLGLVFMAHSADNPQLYRIGHRAVSAVLASGPAAS